MLYTGCFSERLSFFFLRKLNIPQKKKVDPALILAEESIFTAINGGFHN